MVVGERVDVVIVGAGFAGLALACRLAERGLETAVIERREALPSSGAAITLQPNGLAALDRLALLERVEDAGSRMRRVSVRDVDDREIGSWDYAELDHPQPYIVGIKRHCLLTLLAERLAELGGAPPRFGCAFEGLLRSDGALCGVRHSQGELRARHVAGADGVGSAVRSALGIRAFAGRADPYVVGFGARPAQLCDAEALIYLGPGYGNGVMRAAAGAYFWDHVDSAVRPAVEARDFAAWRALYTERVPCGRQVTAGLHSFDELTVLNGRLLLVAGRAEEGAVLVGDAAGAVHPHSGQGANLAIEDAVALGDALLGDERTSPGRGWRLVDYSRSSRRAAAVVRSAVAARTLDAPNGLWRAVRQGTFAAGQVGSIRRRLLAEQAGVGFTS